MKNFLNFLKTMLTDQSGFVWMPLLAGAALGGAKHALIDAPQHKAAQKAQAAQTRYSPWSGMGAGRSLTPPSALNSVMQGGMTGAMLGQSGMFNGAPTPTPTPVQPTPNVGMFSNPNNPQQDIYSMLKQGQSYA